MVLYPTNPPQDTLSNLTYGGDDVGDDVGDNDGDDDDGDGDN